MSRSGLRRERHPRRPRGHLHRLSGRLPGRGERRRGRGLAWRPRRPRRNAWLGRRDRRWLGGRNGLRLCRRRGLEALLGRGSRGRGWPVRRLRRGWLGRRRSRLGDLGGGRRSRRARGRRGRRGRGLRRRRGRVEGIGPARDRLGGGRGLLHLRGRRPGRHRALGWRLRRPDVCLLGRRGPGFRTRWPRGLERVRRHCPGWLGERRRRHLRGWRGGWQGRLARGRFGPLVLRLLRLGRGLSDGLGLDSRLGLRRGRFYVLDRLAGRGRDRLRPLRRLRGTAVGRALRPRPVGVALLHLERGRQRFVRLIRQVRLRVHGVVRGRDGTSLCKHRRRLTRRHGGCRLVGRAFGRRRIVGLGRLCLQIASQSSDAFSGLD